MFEHILVPLDGSALAEVVLPHLVLLSGIGGCRITVARVLDPERAMTAGGPIDPFEWQLRKAEVERYLQDIAGRLSALNVEVETLMLEGRAAESILDFAHAAHADLILLSSHGQSGISGWNISSVVQKIILRARTSIMIVRAYAGPAVELDRQRYERILLPLDGSARAEIAIPAALALAADQQAQLEVVHVVQKPVIPRRTPLTGEEIELSERLIECNRAEAQRYLEELPARLGVQIGTRLLIDDNPAAALHRLIEQDGFQLVVLSAHGYSGETKWSFGSVVISFLAYGATPLLVIQDLPPERIEPTAAEIVFREQGSR